MDVEIRVLTKGLNGLYAVLHKSASSCTTLFFRAQKASDIVFLLKIGHFEPIAANFYQRKAIHRPLYFIVRAEPLFYVKTHTVNPFKPSVKRV